jgi:tetratricopeptide (TPR) repeat protein
MDGMSVRTLVSVAICVALGGCTSKAERIDSGLRKGAQYVARSEWDKASVEARNVLQMDSRNAGAFLIAAEVEDGKGAMRNAFANYAKVVELKPASVDGRLGLARIYLLSGDLARPQDLIDGVLATEPRNTRAQTLQVALMARQGNKAQAIAAADRIVASGLVLGADSSMTLAGLYFNDHAIAKALAVLDGAMATSARDARLPQMAAEVAQAAPREDPMAGRAADYYAKAVGVAPRDDGLWRAWATMHIQRNELAQAEAVLRDAVKAAPDASARRVALLGFTGALRDKAQAEKDYLAAIDAWPKDNDVRFAFAEFLRAQKRPDEAVKVLQAIADAARGTPDGLTARGQIAAVLLETGRMDDARKILAELLKANPRDATGLVLRGRIELADGDARSAVIDLRSAAKDKPGSTDIAALLARAHRMAGDPQLAREALADVVKFNPEDARAHLLLAADMAQSREFRAAIPEVDAAIKLDPRNQAARQMKIEMALAGADLVGAEAEARELENRFPQSVTGHLMHGRVLEAEKKFGPALSEYDAAAKVAPGAADPQVAAVALLTTQHRFVDAGKRIDALAQANPNSVLAHEMRGELALATGDMPAAQAAFQQLVDMAGAPPSAYKNLAAVLVSRKNRSEAFAVLDRGEKAWPADVTLATAHAEWLGLDGRIDEAIAVYERALQRAPASETVANNLAYVLAESKRDKASLERALQLATRFVASSQPSYVDTLGLVQYRLGRFDQAVTLLGRAATMAPADAGVQLHYGMALYRSGDVRHGAEVLRKALATKPPLADHDEAQALVASN